MGLDDDGYTRPPNPDKYLAGDPSRRLVKQVRSDLAQYGIKPQKNLWRMTWQWAHQVQASYICSKRKMWPAANEIAAQYLFLLLKDMQANHLLKLPYRAGQCVPQSVANHLAVPKGCAYRGPQRRVNVADRASREPGTSACRQEPSDVGRSQTDERDAAE